MNFFTRRTMVTVPLVFLFSRLAEAQRRSVRGIVTDQEGKPLKGASVKLKTLQTLQIRSYITQKGGGYHFHGLNPDLDYEVRADFGKVSSPVEKLDRFASNPEVVVNLRIELPEDRRGRQCVRLPTRRAGWRTRWLA